MSGFMCIHPCVHVHVCVPVHVCACMWMCVSWMCVYTCVHVCTYFIDATESSLLLHTWPASYTPLYMELGVFWFWWEMMDRKRIWAWTRDPHKVHTHTLGVALDSFSSRRSDLWPAYEPEKNTLPLFSHSLVSMKSPHTAPRRPCLLSQETEQWLKHMSALPEIQVNTSTPADHGRELCCQLLGT